MTTRVPLSEVPLNHVRRNGQIRQHYASSQNGQSRPETPNGDVNALRKPSSIEGMLRNTTETGDVGQFSIKPSRVPSSIPRPSAGPQSRSQISPSQRSLPGPYYEGNNPYNGRHTPSSSRQGPASSNGSGTPKRSQEQFRRPQLPYRAPSIEDYRSYSMTQSSYTSHSLTHRSPYANGHHQGRGGVYNPRSRSPFAYPTRLKRPGYRPSSPALSDLSRSMLPQSPGVYRDLSTRTASPSSAYNMNRAPSPWQPGFNRSDPMLRYYPAAQHAMQSRARSPSFSSTRPTTPKPSSSLRSVASSSRLRPIASNDWAPEQSLPDSAMFYDYTEAFEEQDLYHSVSMSTGILADPTPPDTETDHYSTQADSPEATSSAELPHHGNPNISGTSKQDAPFNQSHFEINRDAPTWIQAPRQDLSDVLELPEREIQSDQATQDRSEIDYSHRNEDVSDAGHPEDSSRTSATAEHLIKSSDEDPIGAATAEIESNRGGIKLARTSNAGSSSHPDSVFSARSSPRLEIREPTPETRARAAAIIGPQLKLQIPPVGSDNDAKVAELNSAHPVDSLRAPSFEGHSGAEFTEILSPTPERSITSPGSRTRFSKILSIDEGVPELDTINNRSKTGNGNDDSSQLTIHSTIQPSSERLWRRRSSFFRDKPKQPVVVKNHLAEISDSEEEPELTSGLRATFCKPDGQISRRRVVPTPTPLPSKLPRRVLQTPLIAQRSLVRKDENPDPLNSVDVNLIKDDRRGGEEPLPVRTHSSSALVVTKPSPLQEEPIATPRIKPGIVSFSPPVQPIESNLPCSFTPLPQRKEDDESVAELEAVAMSYLRQEERSRKAEDVALPKAAFIVSPDRKSAASPLSSRPWNLEASYPWNNQVPELEVNVPDDTEDPVPRLPRFKLRVHRASSSTGILTKTRNSSDASSGPIASSDDILQGSAYRRKRDPNLFVFPGQINSSHAVMRSSPQHTRFVESFEPHSPTITVIAPSPGPGQEVRSFFSDDSSQMRPRGTFRKRFSDFKARIPRGASSDENRGYDRGLLSSALGRSRASGRSSRQSEHTAGASSHASRIRHLRWKMVEKLRIWWHHGEDRFRDWSWKMRYRRGKYRAASTPLYAGV